MKTVGFTPKFGSTLLCVIRDKVAERCSPVFQAVNQAIALRTLERSIIAERGHPEDYDVLVLAIYDEQTSVIAPNDSPIPIPFTVDKDTGQIKLA